VPPTGTISLRMKKSPPQQTEIARVHFDADPDCVGTVIDTLLAQIFPSPPGDDVQATFEIALAEVINNIIEHACRYDSSSVIDVRVRWCPGGVQFHFVDSGFEMPAGELPPGDLRDLGCARQDLPEGGFGWFLIRSLTDDLHYSRRGGENHLSFRLQTGAVA
jgi:serine/threonine-protein kinase RsbW